ncbi:UNVERIFIED_CONTAM: Retrovirus-related Pol polyprotein from transposon TNT 1-94 [Sesamum latifolium]|uniref:Retrovirus-related Pol polyprotein from transposon TNT 1-94 n=1 Tax=Sesamum latifolium TaxID=2727402 RepID=A0AAW2X330_9LAMI
MIAISIEEEHRNQTHQMSVEHHPRANLIVEKQKVNKVNSTSKAISKGKTTKNKKPKSKQCWNCGQVGHWAKLCPNKKAKTGQAAVNMVVGGASTSGATEGYVSVQPELLTIYEPCDWLIDTGANVHVCADKSRFAFYQAITGRTVSMGNSSTAEVLGIGSVDLKFPSWRSIVKIHHILTVRRNIISDFSPTNLRVIKVFVGRGFECGLPYSEQSPSETQYEYSSCEKEYLQVFHLMIRLPTSIPEHVEKMTNVGVNPSSTNLTHEESDEPRRSKRARVVKDFGSDFITYNIEDDPKKLKSDGSVDKFKARLVAKGFKQNEGIDYFDTYSSVAHLTTIRVLIALASVYNLPIHQMDVKIAFLYGELEEEIYMDQPEGFVAHGNERKVCNLLNLFMDLNKHPNSGMKSLIKLFLHLASP